MEKKKVANQKINLSRAGIAVDRTIENEIVSCAIRNFKNIIKIEFSANIFNNNEYSADVVFIPKYCRNSKTARVTAYVSENGIQTISSTGY